MNKGLITTVFWICFIPVVFCLDAKEEEDRFKAHQRMNTVWQAIASVELADNGRLTPHAILYGGGTEMDVFVTYPAGLMKFVPHEVEVPKKSLPWYCNWYTTCSFIWNWNYSSNTPYYTQDIDPSNSGSYRSPVMAKIWSYDDSKGITKIYASGESAVFRISFATMDQLSFSQSDNEYFQESLATYMEKSLKASIKVTCPPGDTKKVDWRTSREIIPYLFKSQNHQYIKYITRPYYSLFQSAANECRKERAGKENY